MKKTAFMCLVALLALTGCMRAVNITSNNDTPTQVHEVGQATEMSAFSKVNVAGPFDVFYEQGDAYTVRVDGTAEQLKKMTIYVEDEELCIDVTDYHWPQDKNLFKGIKISVTSPDVKDMSITGLGSLVVPDTLKADNLKLLVDGIGDITISKLICSDLGIKVEGQGDIIMGPTQANNVTVEIAGTGDIDITGLSCKQLHNMITGMGDMKYSDLNVGNVKTEIAGMGDVILQGNAHSHEESIAGSGKVDISKLVIATTDSVKRK